MPKNDTLRSAKTAKKNEFFTQYDDIQKEMNSYLEYDPNVFRGKVILLPCDDPEQSNFTKFFARNFEFYGLKKLISTSYAGSPLSIDKKRGRKLILERDINKNGVIDFEDLEWEFLKGDGDFRSDEVKALRDEADIIVTNPPFSLFREFISWIFEANKKFLIIGNMNSITCKDIFPLVKNNQMWYGPSISSGDREFAVPDSYPLDAAGWRVDENGTHYIRVKGVRWFTNLDHGRRHEPLMLMSMADNIKYSRHKEVKGIGYKKYDNYKAIQIPFTDAIPLDYDGLMGVPISFLDKYCPEQFEIIGITEKNDSLKEYYIDGCEKYDRPYLNGERKYPCLLIKKIS